MSRYLITAGPTREPIDAVRFIGNRSSGKMGLAVATAAVAAGHEVTLLLGPVPGLDPAALPARCRVYRFESTAELQQLLEAHFRDHDVLVMAAAVADYRPAQVAEGKIPREPGQGLTLHLTPTPDLTTLMAAARRPGQRIVAFALEEAEALEIRAREKMRRKDADAIVANPLGTMEADAVTAALLTRDGRRLAPGRMTKDNFARWLVAQVDALAADQGTNR